LLAAFSRAAAGRVSVLGVLTEDDQKLALKFAVQFHMPYTSVIDDEGKVLRTYSVGPPVTLFVNTAGDVVFVKRGEIKSRRELASLVKTHLKVDVASSF
jgi:hypothetical protein